MTNGPTTKNRLIPPPLASYVYAYDAASRLTSETINGVAKSYSYDDTNQLTSDNGAGYSYDDNGNRTNSGYVTGPNNQLTTDGVWNYSYDAEGNLVGKTNSASGDTWVYAYDLANHMTSAEERDSSGTLPGPTHHRFAGLSKTGGPGERDEDFRITMTCHLSTLGHPLQLRKQAIGVLTS